MVMRSAVLVLAGSLAFASSQGEEALEHGAQHRAVADSVIAKQRARLAKNTKGQGFGPQSPRDLTSLHGTNKVEFASAPHYTQMSLCDIHFHKNAEHRGGEFLTYAGNGDGHGYFSGYKYSGPALSRSELAPVRGDICPSDHGSLHPGDTIEVHHVFSSAQGARLGNGLGTCLSDAVVNPQLRVEGQVYVLVNDRKAADFAELTKHEKVGGVNQATNIPNTTGTPIEYEGSTTGPSYNEKGSPFQVSWSVRPNVMKVNIKTVGKWCKGNIFEEDHAHGVRNIVKHKPLLSTIDK